MTIRKLAESATGIPDRSEYGKPEALPVGDLATISYQLHLAERAGKHFDFRIGTEDTGLLSWATRKGIPRPGERYAYFEQPVHSYDYGTFEGEIPSGYGKGKVKLLRYGDVLITSAGPDHIKFSMSNLETGKTERFLLRRMNRGTWLMMNITPRLKRPGDKSYVVWIPHRQIQDLAEQISSADRLVRSRGVRAFIKMLRTGAEIMPRDEEVDNVLTEKVVQRMNKAVVPIELRDSLILAEVVGKTKDGRELTPAEVDALLHAPVEDSVRIQREKGIDLKVVPITVLEQPRRKSRSGEERKADIEEVKYTLRQLFGEKEVEEPKRPGKGEPAYIISERKNEVKFVPGRNQRIVYIRDYSLTMGPQGTPIVHSIKFSLEPGGKVVGEITKGIPEELALRLARAPGRYIGKPMLVAFAKELPGNRFRDARFVKMAKAYN